MCKPVYLQLLYTQEFVKILDLPRDTVNSCNGDFRTNRNLFFSVSHNVFSFLNKSLLFKIYKSVEENICIEFI